MAVQAAPRGEKMADIRDAIEAQVQLKRYYLSFKAKEQRDRQLAEAQRLRAQAEKMIRDAERIEAACADWQSGYLAADERVIELRADLLRVENQRKLERLEELAAQLMGGGE